LGVVGLVLDGLAADVFSDDFVEKGLGRPVVGSWVSAHFQPNVLHQAVEAVEKIFERGIESG